MRNISYKVKGSDCVTPCSINKGVMVGSYACQGCENHFQKLGGLKQVICKA